MPPLMTPNEDPQLQNFLTPGDETRENENERTQQNLLLRSPRLNLRRKWRQFVYNTKTGLILSSHALLPEFYNNYFGKFIAKLFMASNQSVSTFFVFHDESQYFIETRPALSQTLKLRLRK